MKKTAIAVFVLLFLATIQLTAASLTLAWDKSNSTNIIKQRLYQSVQSNSFAVQSVLSDVPSEITVSNLMAGTNYRFQITAVNTTGLESDPGNVVSFTVPGATTNPIPPVTGTLAITNQTPITVPSIGAATPYPSKITVAGMSGAIESATVTLRNFAQTYPGDVDVLLVSPTGQKAMILSDVGNTFDVSNVTVTLSDTAATALPVNSMLTTGTFKPTDASPGEARDLFPSPAPPGPYTSTLSTFKGFDPNGTWSLYVNDDGPGDSGSFAGGWALSITTTGGAATNNPPVVSSIADMAGWFQLVWPPMLIPFTLTDDKTPVTNLVLSAASSDLSILPASGLLIGGIGTNRTLLVTPAKTGVVTVTVSASDGTLTGSNSFKLTVSAPSVP